MPCLHDDAGSTSQLVDLARQVLIKHHSPSQFKYINCNGLARRAFIKHLSSTHQALIKQLLSSQLTVLDECSSSWLDQPASLRKHVCACLIQSTSDWTWCRQLVESSRAWSALVVITTARLSTSRVMMMMMMMLMNYFINSSVVITGHRDRVLAIHHSYGSTTNADRPIIEFV